MDAVHQSKAINQFVYPIGISLEILKILAFQIAKSVLTSPKEVAREMRRRNGH